MGLEDGAKITVKNSTISESSTPYYFGIYIDSSGSQWPIEMTLENSQVSKNSGGGIRVEGPAKLTIKNSTISENSGAGLDLSNREWQTAQLSLVTIENSTISGNVDGILIGSGIQAILRNNRIFDNRGYGVALSLRPCASGGMFEGKVEGSGNAIYDNYAGNLCPSRDLYAWPEGFEAGPQGVKKAQLVEALNKLKKAVLDKIDSDIGYTAQAFTDVKDYWRSKRWADIFTAPLRVLENTLSVLAQAVDLKGLAEAVNASLDKSEAVFQILSTIMMIQDLQEAGKKLHYGLDGPAYIAAIESMLEAADATTIPPAGFSREHYKRVIENHLYGTAEDTPLIIPRRSPTVARRITEFAKGALQVRSSIAKIFNDLIAEIEGRELPEDFPIDEVITQINSLKTQILKSMSYGVDVAYMTYLRDGEQYIPVQVETKLGAVGDLYRAFGQIAGLVAEKAAIEARVEVLKLIETGESAALLYTITYEIPGAEEIKVAQKANILAGVLIESYEKLLHEDAEEKFYLLPQEMMLILPMELSNLWMIAGDIDQYLWHLLQ